MPRLAHRRAEGQEAPAADPIASALFLHARDAVRDLEELPHDAPRRERAGNALASLLSYTSPQEGPAGSEGWCM
jgi:hypothetical protein